MASTPAGCGPPFWPGDHSGMEDPSWVGDHNCSSPAATAHRPLPPSACGAFKKLPGNSCTAAADGFNCHRVRSSLLARGTTGHGKSDLGRKPKVLYNPKTSFATAERLQGMASTTPCCGPPRRCGGKLVQKEPICGCDHSVAARPTPLSEEDRR